MLRTERQVRMGEGLPHEAGFPAVWKSIKLCVKDYLGNLELNPNKKG